MAMLLSVRKMKKVFGEKQVLKDINFDISIGDRVGLVGLNGAGKSTLVNIISGGLAFEEGSVLWHKKSINIGCLKQDAAYMKSLNCEDNYESFLKVSSNLSLQKIQK